MGLGAPGQDSEEIWAVEIFSYKVGRGGGTHILTPRPIRNLFGEPESVSNQQNRRLRKYNAKNRGQNNVEGRL